MFGNRDWRAYFLAVSGFLRGVRKGRCWLILTRGAATTMVRNFGCAKIVCQCFMKKRR